MEMCIFTSARYLIRLLIHSFNIQYASNEVCVLGTGDATVNNTQSYPQGEGGAQKGNRKNPHDVISQGSLQTYLGGRGRQSRVAVFVAKMEKGGENDIRIR